MLEGGEEADGVLGRYDETLIEVAWCFGVKEWNLFSGCTRQDFFLLDFEISFVGGALEMLKGPLGGYTPRRCLSDGILIRDGQGLWSFDFA